MILISDVTTSGREREREEREWVRRRGGGRVVVIPRKNEVPLTIWTNWQKCLTVEEDHNFLLRYTQVDT